MRHTNSYKKGNGTDPETGFNFIIHMPAVIVTINAGKARYTFQGIIDDTPNIRSAAHDIVGY